MTNEDELELTDAGFLRKVALVTGASRGIGRATALALARAGARLFVHYGRGAKEAEAVVSQIRAAKGSAEAIVADLSAPDGAHRLAKQVRNIVGKRLDVLALNAGIADVIAYLASDQARRGTGDTIHVDGAPRL